jgi:xylitol oxidase
VTETNWGGNYIFRARRIHRPTTLEQVQELVAAAPRVRVLGSRHSFTGIVDSDELVALDAMPADVVVDHAAGTVSVGAGVRYGELAEALRAEGVALHNLASLPHISIAGAIATATHGSGDANGNLATAVAGLELGAVTRLTLDVEPAYDVRQRVFEGLSWSALFEHFDEISARGYSVSVFTRWGETAGHVWVKSRVSDDPERVSSELFGALAATVERHPIPGLDPVNCTPQLGVAGWWADRLPHFRMGFTPSNGEEIQSEYHVPRRAAIAAIEAVRGVADVVVPLLQVCEIRTIAADRLWMSTQYERDTVALHFTWKREPDALPRVLVDLEAALAPFQARPHWGKAFLADAATIAGLYERLPDFIALAERLDPRGAFRNAWLETHVLGGAAAPPQSPSARSISS